MDPIEQKRLRRRDSDAGLRTYQKDLDREVLKRLAERHGHEVPKDRLDAMAKLHTEFVNRDELRRRHREVTGTNPSHGTRGFSVGLERPAVVRTDQEPAEVVETVMHERLHQLSDPRARETMRRKTHEGWTENFTQHELGRTPRQGDRVAYPKETMQAELLRNKCGERALRDAYFKGDTRELKTCLDKLLRNMERKR
jgi:hypothetical protein